MKKILFVLFILAAFMQVNAQMNLLYDFGNDAQCVNMRISSLLCADSALYGISYNSKIFKLSLASLSYAEIFTMNADSSQGYFPVGGFASKDSTLYGVTNSGGKNSFGTIFRIGKNGTGYTKLHDFNYSYGASPVAALAVNNDTLYGMTSSGGSNSAGVIFKFGIADSVYTVIYNFSTTVGCSPSGSLISSGPKLYGMASGCGSHGDGVLFSLNTDGSGFDPLVDFIGSNGKTPAYDLVMVDSLLYGITRQGGAKDSGALFVVGINGTGFQLLHSFTGTGGTYPCSSPVIVGSQVYGMAINYTNYSRNIVLYTMHTDGSNYQLLYDFGFCGTDNPAGSLAVVTQNLFGIVNTGGIYCGPSPVLFSYELTPAIQQQPQDNNYMYTGDTAVYSIIATGSGLAYHWQFSADSGRYWSDISGSTGFATFSGWRTDSLLLTAITPACGGLQFRCLITGLYGDSLISQSVSIQSPQITGNPTDAIGCPGGYASFSVSAFGTGLGYQWQAKTGSQWNDLADGDVYYGSQEGTLQLYNISENINGTAFRCVLKGAVNAPDTSAVVSLLIGASIDIGKQPSETSVPAGGTASFTIKADGIGLSYLWQLSSNGGNDWNDITGLSNRPLYHGWTTDSLWLSNINKFSNGYEFRCVIYNLCSSDTSAEVTLNVLTGITSLQAGGNDILLYPNPAGGDVNLQFSANEYGTLVITLFNAMGEMVNQLLGQKSTPTYLQNLSFPGLAEGIYFVKVVCGSRIIGWSRLVISY